MFIESAPMNPVLLTIVQPYLPQYRVAFFKLLSDELNSHDILMRVIAPAPRGDQAARADDTSPLPFVIRTRMRRYGLPRLPKLSYYGSYPHLRSSDLIVTPAAGTALDSHLAINMARRGNKQVGLWGHIDSYVNSASRLDRLIESRMLTAASHVFSYTAGGAEAALGFGVSEDRISILNNTIDTGELVTARAQLTANDVTRFRSEFGIATDRVYSFIGGLDTEKGVDFLVEVLDHLFSIVGRNVQVLVAGDGVEARKLEESVIRGQAIRLGYADAKTKALMAAVSSGLINPGRIGLIAVDALTLQQPIITDRQFDRHAPEVEYLDEGNSLISVDGGPAAFARYLLTHSPRTIERPAPSIQNMVGRFTDGILAMRAKLQS